MSQSWVKNSFVVCMCVCIKNGACKLARILCMHLILIIEDSLGKVHKFLV